MSSPVVHQVIGDAVHTATTHYQQQIIEKLNASLAQRDLYLNRALNEMSKVTDFLARPENILGSAATKHGEIAEVAEVAKRNSEALFKGREAVAELAKSRIAPEDYYIFGEAIQSKYINGANNTLEHVLTHMKKYSEFGRNGSYYHIPKDIHEQISKIANGEQVPELSSKTVNAILKKINEIEELSGKSFNDIVKSGSYNYKDVQTGEIAKTIEKEKEAFTQKNENIKEKQKAEAAQKVEPSLEGMAKAGILGAAIGGTLSFSFSVYAKKKDGKSLFDYDEQDWKDIGLDTAKGAGKSGISGASIYGLTQFCKMGAPMASAVVSTTFGITELLADYKKGEINEDELIEGGLIVCAESSLVAAGAIIGQTMIPIPVLGTLVGSIAASQLSSIIKGELGKDSKVFEEKLLAISNEAMLKINEEFRNFVQRMLEHYAELGELTVVAFDLDLNIKIRTEASIALAKKLNVSEEFLLETEEDIDSFFLD